MAWRSGHILNPSSLESRENGRASLRGYHKTHKHRPPVQSSFSKVSLAIGKYAAAWQVQPAVRLISEGIVRTCSDEAAKTPPCRRSWELLGVVCHVWEVNYILNTIHELRWWIPWSVRCPIVL